MREALSGSIAQGLNENPAKNNRMLLAPAALPVQKACKDIEAQRSMKKFAILKKYAAGAALLCAFQASVAAQEGANPDQRIGVLLAVGDVASCYEQAADPKYEAVAKVIGAEITKAGNLPVAVLALGDLAYSNRKDGELAPPFYSDCFKLFEKHWGPFYDRILPVPGNHDFSDDPTKGTVFKHYFAKRLNDVGADEEAWFYATKFPATGEGWLLAGLNFYRGRDRQRTWLAERLRQSSERCVLAFTHPFLHSSGKHGRAYDHWTYRHMQPFMSILYTAGASVLLSAHDHHLEQFAKHDAAGSRAQDGVRSFIVGTGGAPLYSVPDRRRHPLSEFFANKSFGVLKLDLYKDRYTWSFVVASGPSITLPGGGEDCTVRKSSP